MWKLTLLIVTTVTIISASDGVEIKTGEELVSSVISDCLDMDCVKQNVLSYLDTYLDNNSRKSRKLKNLDATIYKRISKILKTHEIRVTLPEILFDKTEIVYNPKSGFDVATPDVESRGLLKKKLFLPILLLLKLKMKALMPIFVALIGLKSLKALILSKLAIAIVLGFVVYQFVNKAGMAMPMSITPSPSDPPMSLYGAPVPSTSPPSSYEPGWEPNNPGGPYSRVWSPNSDSQNLAYSGYYPGSGSSSTARP